MNILIRYLSSEAIENCISCLNHHFEKAIFFGYREVIEEERGNISGFLENKCDTISEFIDIRNRNLEEVSALVKGVLNDEDRFYFDMTGCDGLCEIVFSTLAYERNIPMHICDIRRDEIFNVDNELNGSIFDVKKKKQYLLIKDYIKMVGGSIKYNQNKKHLKMPSEEQLKKLEKIKHDHEEKWTAFSVVLQRINRYREDFYCECQDIVDVLNKINNRIRAEELLQLFSELQEADLIRNFRNERGHIGFYYADGNIESYLADAGAALEFEVYTKEKQKAKDCRIGVYLDWDGIDTNEGDVYNEIDVLSLYGNCLTFISCKNTKQIVNKDLYELETVGRRFGGDYARLKLVTTAQVLPTERNRAALMGIEIVEWGKD